VRARWDTGIEAVLYLRVVQQLFHSVVLGIAHVGFESHTGGVRAAAVGDAKALELCVRQSVAGRCGIKAGERQMSVLVDSWGDDEINLRDCLRRILT